MNPRYSDLRLPTEMQRRIPSLGDSLSRRTLDLQHAGTNLATGLSRLGMTTTGECLYVVHQRETARLEFGG